MRIIIAIILTTLCVARGKTLRVSVTRMAVSAPLFVAQERGLFKKAGLQVELREYELGKLALGFAEPEIGHQFRCCDAGSL